MDLKVLFIGYDRDILLMTGKILRRSRYEVVTAAGRSEALRLLGRDNFDLIIFDCDMGAADRLSIIEAVKESPASIPLLLISGHKEDEVPLLRAGADDWIRKPYEMDVLLARMAALLRHKSPKNNSDQI